MKNSFGARIENQISCGDPEPRQCFACGDSGLQPVDYDTFAAWFTTVRLEVELTFGQLRKIVRFYFQTRAIPCNECGSYRDILEEPNV